jgi:hypothetical protein
MRSIYRAMLLALLAVLALSAVAAGAAQAAEGPFYKIAGARLASGGSKEVKLKAHSEYLTIRGEEWTVQCKTQALAAGAKLLGSTGANSGAGEVTIELSGCRYSPKYTEEKCSVQEPITTMPLKAKLVYLGSARSGGLGVYLQPVKGEVFVKIVFTKSEGCHEQSLKVAGSEVAEIYSGNNPVEVGKEPTEAAAAELRFPIEGKQPLKVWSEESGALVEHQPGLGSSLGGFWIEGEATLELAGGANWGVFT